MGLVDELIHLPDKPAGVWWGRDDGVSFWTYSPAA